MPQLFEFLEQGGLRFGRWLQQAPYSPRCGVLVRIPQAEQIARMPLVEQFAAVELFRGNMLTHSVIAYRSDRPGGPPQLEFAGDDCLALVPIRQPDTLRVQERLPPGAAAVLINRTHPFTDLYLPISEQHQHWFDAIDGQRSIGEIVADGTRHAAARELFEALWWHDQVVFDASRRTVSNDHGVG